MHCVTLFTLQILAFCSLFNSANSMKSKVEMDIATEMYLYAWPLVMTSLTRKSMLYLPPNIMLPLPVFPNPNLTAIVKPNVDTLYDACWIDFSKSEDLVLKIPDTSDVLYYLFPLMDAWTNILNSPGWRTTGKAAQNILLRGPFSNESDPLPEEYAMFIKSTTNTAYLLGRTNVADQTNLKPTQQQLFSYKLTHDGTSNLNEVPSDKSNPKEEIFAMSAQDFFTTFSELLVNNPPILPQDEVIIQKMAAEFGLVAGEMWDYRALSVVQKQQVCMKSVFCYGVKISFCIISVFENIKCMLLHSTVSSHFSSPTASLVASTCCMATRSRV